MVSQKSDPTFPDLEYPTQSFTASLSFTLIFQCPAATALMHHPTPNIMLYGNALSVMAWGPRGPGGPGGPGTW